MKFKKIKFRKYDDGDKAATVDIGGYTVSIIRNVMSDGHEEGLYEMGIFYKGTKEMCDPLGWGNESKGWLTPEDISAELAKLQTLEK